MYYFIFYKCNLTFILKMFTPTLQRSYEGGTMQGPPKNLKCRVPEKKVDLILQQQGVTEPYSTVKTDRKRPTRACTRCSDMGESIYAIRKQNPTAPQTLLLADQSVIFLDFFLNFWGVSFANYCFILFSVLSESFLWFQFTGRRKK